MGTWCYGANVEAKLEHRFFKVEEMRHGARWAIASTVVSRSVALSGTTAQHSDNGGRGSGSSSRLGPRHHRFGAVGVTAQSAPRHEVLHIERWLWVERQRVTQMRRLRSVARNVRSS